MTIEIIFAFGIIVAIGCIILLIVAVIRLQNKVDRLDKIVAKMSCYLAELRKREILPPLSKRNKDD